MSQTMRTLCALALCIITNSVDVALASLGELDLWSAERRPRAPDRIWRRLAHAQRGRRTIIKQSVSTRDVYKQRDEGGTDSAG